MDIISRIILVVLIVYGAKKLFDSIEGTHTCLKTVIKQLSVSNFPIVSYEFLLECINNRDFWNGLYEKYDKLNEKKEKDENLTKAVWQIVAIMNIYDDIIWKAKEANAKVFNGGSRKEVLDKFFDYYEKQTDRIYLEEMKKLRELKISDLNTILMMRDLDFEFKSKNGLD